jgi:FixJ family two-component response regulator
MQVASLIVCIEDDASVRDAIKELLRAYGFRVEVYASAEEFLATAALDHVSCLITDLRLGGMSGLDLYRSLTGLGRPTPTILISGYLDENTRLQALSEGVNCVFGKPVPADKLIACVTEVLGRSSNGAGPL